TGATYEVSVDNGLNYVSINHQERIVLTSNLGNNLLVRVTITDSTTQIDSLSALYS
ncbi:unnamed protein product, partial [marine sediment metagenome]